MRNWVAALSIIGFAAGAVTAGAQNYPVHRGDNNRDGALSSPFVYNPGAAYLNWWQPNSSTGLGTTYIRDNTSLLITATSGWSDPTSLKYLADDTYTPVQTGNATEDANVSSFFNSSSSNYLKTPIVPAYVYTATTPSMFELDSSTYDPTVPESGTAQTFTWDLTPDDGVARSYAVYVWLPTGPTGSSSSSLLYPQEYYVYKVTFANGATFTDVVDTSVAGAGWVRLGNGGATTNKVFLYNGSGSLKVTLYNTIPRDSSGNLLENPDQTTTLVYADAAMAQPSHGSYSASPIINQLTNGTVTNVVVALNQYNVGMVGTTYTTNTQGLVTSYNAADGSVRWTYSPLAESELSVNLIPGSALIKADTAWVNSTTASGYLGPYYYVSNAQPAYNSTGLPMTPAPAQVSYSPTLSDGDYAVYIWVTGDNNGVVFPDQAGFEIDEGSTVSYAYVDETSGPGWVQVGSRRYQHQKAEGAPLTVKALNYSNDPGEPTTCRGYAGAMRFVGAANMAINSTPLQVNGALIKMDTTSNPPVATDVTIVAAENGRIYCLDSNGNGNGTTNVYWTYPSTPDPSNSSWTDPNQVAGLDGVDGIAEMPGDSGFSLSSALVQRINGVDYLYIAAQNGRVYCIDMTGRGDRNATTGLPGTTKRVWSYPDDYPATVQTSALGAFTGSVSFYNLTAGPTIFVPAPQGRIYALDAVGNGSSKRTTNVRWEYPAATSQALGSIVSTPAIGVVTTNTPSVTQLFFGTQAASDAATGEFYALNAETGAVIWKFTGTTSVPADDFLTSPAFVPSASLVYSGNSQADTVYVANENGYVYALDAAGKTDGTTTVDYATDELGAGVQAGISFTPINAYLSTGLLSTSPIPAIIVPTTDGRLDALSAIAGVTNVDNLYQLWEYDAGSSFIASAAVGQYRMLAATGDGYLYCFGNTAGYLSPGTPPGGQTGTANNPSSANFQNVIVEFIGQTDYNTLLTDQTSSQPVTYSQLQAITANTGSPLAFEWGQTVYALMYNFPYGSATLPPQANFTFTGVGGTTRTVAVQSSQLEDVTAGTNPPYGADGTTLLDGYAVVAYTLQGSGQTALVPGTASMSATITTGALSTTGARQTFNIAGTNSKAAFAVANPLALLMDGTSDLLRAIGYTTNAADPENLENGSGNVSSSGKIESQLLSSVGLVAHGQSGSSVIGVVDRSLMTLLLGPGRGLSNVRYTSTNLAWNGGSAAVYKPLNSTLYPNYEDLPVDYPNISLDYPDIGRQNVTVVANPTGTAQNPQFSATTLVPPTIPDTTNPAVRTLNVTPFDLTVSVPLYQPPNSTTTSDSTGAFVDAGYLGMQRVFVDSAGTGVLSTTRDAYRTFNLAANVDIDERLTVETPTVDLGSLPEGAMFSPAPPWDSTDNTEFKPINDGVTPYAQYFQPFVVTNPGNVNLLDLRVAKMTEYGTNPVTAWPIYGPANHPLSWFDPAVDVFSSLDDDPRWDVTDFNGNVHHYVVLQKPRVGDGAPTTLNVDTPQRVNANLGADGSWRLIGQTGTSAVNSPYWTIPPSITATPPIGWPVGTYLQTMRVVNIENGYPEYTLGMDTNGNGLEAYSDPTFILRFNVRESRLTNSYTPGTAPMIDNYFVPTDESNRFLHSNMQPTALRTSDTGSLVVAFASTRTSFTQAEPGSDAVLDPVWRIYLGSLLGSAPSGSSGFSPLRELNYFSPASGTQWFQQSASAPFPPCSSAAQANSLFKVDTSSGYTAILGTASFGSPSFPVQGYTTNSGPFPGTYMAFVGETQVQTPSGRASASRIFLAPMTVDSSGSATLGSWIRNDSDDPTVHKGKPSVIEDSSGYATVFFAGNASGQSQLFYTCFNPNMNTTVDPPHDRWTPLTGLSVGTGFESVSSPSVSTRIYDGPNYTPCNLVTGEDLIEMTFVGKLRGRPNQEVFYGRILDAGHYIPATNANGSPEFMPLPFRVEEPLTLDSGGVYRSLGVTWNLAGGFKLEQILNGVVTNLEVTDSNGNPTTRAIDGTTGLMTFDSTLGGKVYVDPNVGTIRFSNATPSSQAVLLLSYQPLFLRVSGPGQDVSYTSPTGLYDTRLVGDASYWGRLDGTGVRNTDSDVIPMDRYVFTYSESAVGGAQAAEPFVRTMRYGVQLPAAVATNSDGTIAAMSVTGCSGPYQVDAPNGRIYFTDLDENNSVSVTYTWVDNSGKNTGSVTLTNLLVGLVPESDETPITIEQARDEAGLTAVLDPFNPSGVIDARRPGLVWLFWSSTRGGAPDIFFETIAPNWSNMPAAK
jgi:hypothetical protein